MSKRVNGSRADNNDIVRMRILPVEPLAQRTTQADGKPCGQTLQPRVNLAAMSSEEGTLGREAIPSDNEEELAVHSGSA